MKDWGQALALSALALSAFAPQAQAQVARYQTEGLCNGLPRLPLATPAGYCAALVADASSGLRFPRRILEVAPGHFWLVDMGGWEAGQGRLLAFSQAPGGTGPVLLKTLMSGLDRPHGLVLGPEGQVYVGEAGRIWRTPIQDSPQPEVLLNGLPADGAHPLKEMAFAPDGRLFFNLGAYSDACRNAQGEAPWPCPEREGKQPRAAVYLLKPGNRSPTPYALGLRNSLGLAWLPQARALVQAENSIDLPAADQPPEELNLLQEGGDYGWPACLGRRQAAPAYADPSRCAGTLAPLQLWPAHAAPLQLLLAAPRPRAPWSGKLIVVWHGHRPAGHRVLAYALNANTGLPMQRPSLLLGDWDAKPGIRPRGAPAGVTVDRSGRLWVVEDRNRTLIVVQPETSPAAQP